MSLVHSSTQFLIYSSSSDQFYCNFGHSHWIYLPWIDLALIWIVGGTNSLAVAVVDATVRWHVTVLLCSLFETIPDVFFFFGSILLQFRAFPLNIFALDWFGLDLNRWRDQINRVVVVDAVVVCCSSQFLCAWCRFLFSIPYMFLFHLQFTSWSVRTCSLLHLMRDVCRLSEQRLRFLRLLSTS